ncbi:MAG: hypothetical protein ACAI43_26890 [Phycisphaerae bacterium]|nr:hypothetical protein [Tepidisphaeraceae bacterium]
MTVELILYRAVSFAELADVRRCGRLRSGPGSCEGKHLACTRDDARRWGEALSGGQGFALLRVMADEAAVTTWVFWARLDGIGPAYFATIEELAGTRVEEVIDEP